MPRVDLLRIWATCPPAELPKLDATLGKANLRNHRHQECIVEFENASTVFVKRQRTNSWYQNGHAFTDKYVYFFLPLSLSLLVQVYVVCVCVSVSNVARFIVTGFRQC